tara:strand:+ start:461 stop:1099 length:639 start_codon:yes stop_codon:yes gene_type:complete
MSTIEEVINVEQPTIIEIILYRNNWKDNQLIHTLKRDSQMINISEKKDSFYVDVEDFTGCLKKFDKEIEKIDALPEEGLLDSVNSLYFLKNVFSVFDNLKFVKVNVSSKRMYSRVVKESISFSLKVVYSTVKLRNYLKDGERRVLIRDFKTLGFVQNDGMFISTYVSVRFSDLMNKIKSSFSEDKQTEIIEKLFYIVDPKTENDDPMILFIF